MSLDAAPNRATYRALQALPTAPDGLLKKLYAGTKGQGPTRDAAAFEAIDSMLTDATLLPDVSAAPYRAAAKLPNVVFEYQAKDAFGRPGSG